MGKSVEETNSAFCGFCQKPENHFSSNQVTTTISRPKMNHLRFKFFQLLYGTSLSTAFCINDSDGKIQKERSDNKKIIMQRTNAVDTGTALSGQHCFLKNRMTG